MKKREKVEAHLDWNPDCTTTNPKDIRRECNVLNEVSPVCDIRNNIPFSNNSYELISNKSCDISNNSYEVSVRLSIYNKSTYNIFKIEKVDVELTDMESSCVNSNNNSNNLQQDYSKKEFQLE